MHRIIQSLLRIVLFDFSMDTIGDDSGCRGRLGLFRYGGVPSNVFSVAGDLLRFGVAQLARRLASLKF